MTGMDDIETTIGEDDTLTMGAGVLHGHDQLLGRQHPKPGALLMLHRPTQFRRADGSGTQLADDDAGGQVGQAHGVG